MNRSTGRTIQLLPLFLIVWTVLNSQTGRPETFQFTAQELANQQATWSPGEVTIRRNRDPQDELVFVLVNPTKRTHAFESPGLLELAIDDQDGPLARPLRVTVAPGESLQIRVGVAQGEREPDPACTTAGECYRFYCPLHRGDNDPGGIIRVIP
ncbi:MAG TPA: hypothetical protein VNK46_01785 [Nitrospiraceae bacterium]|jgi:hypothetical protein|nr:hypothetical protein [Nitrospiraceae bacterium]